jgi:phosphoribosyl-AMP cyclohydrolase
MLKFDDQGLIPAVIVDDVTDDVLVVAFMNQEALQRTRETGYTHFYSRSRQKLWRKGEQSGNVQEVRDIFINCEENSVLIRVVQHGGAACHEGYHSCYYRRLLPDDSYETVAQRIFDPEEVYHVSSAETPADSTSQGEKGMQILQMLENELRQLYSVYIYLRDQDMTTESNTSRLLHEDSHSYLVSRLADELQELAGVQSGEHVHRGKQVDTILEGSQVGYWLFLFASTKHIPFDDFAPHAAMLHGYTGQYSEEKVIEIRQECLQALKSHDPLQVAHGLQMGFSVIGWACASAGISPLAPAEYDLEQMRNKGLVK